jgi:hypothetical protein
MDPDEARLIHYAVLGIIAAEAIAIAAALAVIAIR